MDGGDTSRVCAKQPSNSCYIYIGIQADKFTTLPSQRRSGHTLIAGHRLIVALPGDLFPCLDVGLIALTGVIVWQKLHPLEYA
jgi:hypothetical protein